MKRKWAQQLLSNTRHVVSFDFLESADFASNYIISIWYHFQCNVSVTSIKIDPYINIDAGTFSPYEHGEVYVLDDGGEVDLDLGNYERVWNNFI